jgi:DNA-binding transcriptional ArsR family regulator
MRRDVFQAIADPVRREIIELLSKEPLSVNNVAENFEISRPAVSKHLKILQECGIVAVKKEGRERFCFIEPHKLVPAFLWIDRYKSLWEYRVDAFENYVNSIHKNSKRHE